MRVAVVEQSRVGLKILNSMLVETGHDVVAFRDGVEALECIQSDFTIDVLLTSLEVPSISGLQLCWEARLLAGNSRAIYVIAMSSTYDVRTLEKALDSGADDFIMKPPDRQHLVARLRAAERLLSSQRKLIDWANLDPLTNLLNRRAFMEQASSALQRARDSCNHAVALIVDIDHFKRVNDTYGHDVGDIVIRQVAELIGKSPISGRLGGEEFAVLLEQDTCDACHVADALRSEIASLTFETEVGEMSVTISIGLASLQPGDTMRSILKRADVALYAAKRSGRNRVVDHAMMPDVAAA